MHNLPHPDAVLRSTRQEAFKYAAESEDTTTAASAWQAIQTCREGYNHALTQEYKPVPDYDKPSYNTMQNKLPQ